MKIHPERMLERLEERIAETTNPRHQAMLQTIRAHTGAELEGIDVGRIMETMVAEPQFHWYGFGYGDVGPKGRQEVEAHYRRFVGDGCNLHEQDFRRIVVDDHNVVLEGPMHIVFPGAALRSRQIDVDDPDAYYLYSYDVCAIFHFDENGRCTGEDSYGDGAPTSARLKKLAPEELPEGLSPVR